MKNTLTLLGLLTILSHLEAQKPAVSASNTEYGVRTDYSSKFEFKNLIPVASIACMM